MTLEFGLLLPHFGGQADARAIVRRAARAESLGFASLWVRDHLFLGAPAGGDGGSLDFLEALTVLTAVGTATETVRLGTAALVPLRHPLYTALVAATMSRFLGPRLVFGVGGGSTEKEFAALGLAGTSRIDLLLANMAIMRRAWTGETFSWSDPPFSFADVAIHPVPAQGSIPFWYCGDTPRAARLAAEHCEGWLPGRITLETIRARIALMDETSRRIGRRRPVAGVAALTSIARTRREAEDAIDIGPLLRTANAERFWVRPASGEFESRADLEGMLICGAPEDVVGQVQRLERAGVEHVVFDFRLGFDRWDEQMELVGREVLPAFAGTGSTHRPGR